MPAWSAEELLRARKGQQRRLTDLRSQLTGAGRAGLAAAGRCADAEDAGHDRLDRGGAQSVVAARQVAAADMAGLVRDDADELRRALGPQQ